MQIASQDSEEVAGQDSATVGAEEIAPTHSAPSRSGWNPAVMEDAANRADGHVVVELIKGGMRPTLSSGTWNRARSPGPIGQVDDPPAQVLRFVLLAGKQI